MMKKIFLTAAVMLCLVSCGAEVENNSLPSSQVQSSADVESLRKKYPEYFELGDFKGIEVYVWQMTEDSYQCGLMSGTNRNKTEEEIMELAQKPLTVDEAKLILDELGVKGSDIIVIPVIQPYSSYHYEIDDEYRERVEKLFK